MNIRPHLAIVSCLLVVAACSSEASRPTESSNGTEPADDAVGAEQDASPSSSRDAGAEGADDQDASAHDTGLTLPTNDAGCLTYAAAQQVCGFNSDGSVCKFAAQCGAATDVGQCKINCEMQSTITCFAAVDALCLLNALNAKACTAISACKWKL